MTKKFFTEDGEEAMAVDLARCAEDIDAGLKKVLDFYHVQDEPAAELRALSRPQFILRMQGQPRAKVLEAALSFHAALQTQAEPVTGARVRGRNPTKEEREARALAAFSKYDAMKPGQAKREFLAKHGTQILAGAKLHEHSKK